jgi:hypothetical protein
MIKLVKKFIGWLYIKIHSMILMISLALHGVENEVLKADSLIYDEKDKKIQRHRHRNILLEKFYAGERDEKYVQDYYELLKKADKFLKNATKHKMEVAAYKYGTNFGMKDKYGRRYEHYGFFDDNHKHAGKTLGDVLELEMKERGTKDDDFPLIYVFNNTPIEKGVSNILDIVEEVDDEKYNMIDMQRKSKQFEFPIKPYRKGNVDVVNKIEQLTEYLHIKHVGLEHIQLEFFVPLKYGTNKIDDNSDIFKDIVNIDGVYIKDDYGDSLWFGIKEYKKRIIYNNTHEVWKFKGIVMDKMGG